MTVDAARPDGYGTIKSSRHDTKPKRPSTASSTSVGVGQLEEHEIMYSRWRHTLGVLCLTITVFLWTASNFLASDIFADNTYSKPYFITYINTAIFILPLIPISIVKLIHNPSSIYKILPGRRRGNGADRYSSLSSSSASPSSPSRAERPRRRSLNPFSGTGKLSFRATAKLALEFCLLWFLANYLVAACLSYTTVASATLLTSTSSIFTLLFSTVSRIEPFTLAKLLAVLAAFLGVALTTTSDWSGDSDAHRGTFPHKSRGELMLGNVMALGSAACYGAYAVLLKARIGDESRVDMPLFFGFVGAWNVVLLWPGLVALHLLGVEPFELPPTARVTAVVLANAGSSLVSDMTWALAMLFTSPLLVTVGLSLTIPLSLVGQILIDAQYVSWVYWLGAVIVVCSFVFINNVEANEGALAASSSAAGPAEVGDPALLAPQSDEEADVERERW